MGNWVRTRSQCEHPESECKIELAEVRDLALSRRPCRPFKDFGFYTKWDGHPLDDAKHDPTLFKQDHCGFLIGETLQENKTSLEVVAAKADGSLDHRNSSRYTKQKWTDSRSTRFSLIIVIMR